MKPSFKQPARLRRSGCPVANTLDLLGDKWSLLLVRELLLHGKRTYGELLQVQEAIPTNILAERLKRLEAAGVLISAAYQQHPPRYTYELSDKGLALGPVLLAIVKWGLEYIPGTKPPVLPAAVKGKRRTGSTTPNKSYKSTA